jgi:heme oxygenase
MDLARLKAETATEHTATEETVPLMSTELTLEEYLQVLRRFTLWFARGTSGATPMRLRTCCH